VIASGRFAHREQHGGCGTEQERDGAAGRADRSPARICDPSVPVRFASQRR